jgi:hypothetical protein
LALAALLVPASGGALWAVALAVAAVGAAVALRIRKSRARESGMARGPARRRERNSMRVEATLAPADEIGVAYSPRRTAYAKPFVLFLAWFGITGVVLGGLFLEQGHRLTLKQLLIAAALMIVPFLVSYFDREMKADALASAAPGVVSELRPEGIQVERQGRGSLLENVLVRWQDLQGMKNTRDHILLQTRTDRFVVPMRCFSSPAECTRFMQYIQAHVRAGRS